MRTRKGRNPKALLQKMNAHAELRIQAELPADNAQILKTVSHKETATAEAKETAAESNEPAMNCTKLMKNIRERIEPNVESLRICPAAYLNAEVTAESIRVEAGGILIALSLEKQTLIRKKPLQPIVLRLRLTHFYKKNPFAKWYRRASELPVPPKGVATLILGYILEQIVETGIVSSSSTIFVEPDDKQCFEEVFLPLGFAEERGIIALESGAVRVYGGCAPIKTVIRNCSDVAMHRAVKAAESEAKAKEVEEAAAKQPEAVTVDGSPASKRQKTSPAAIL